MYIHMFAFRFKPGVTDAQKETAKKVSDEMRTKMREVFQGAGGDFEKAQEGMKKLNDEAAKTINEMLKPEQSKRLKQIEIQVGGFNALTREEVQKDLKLTDKQVTEIKDIAKDMQKDIQGLGQPDFTDQEEMKKRGEKIQAMNKDSLAKALKTLNDDQKKTWAEMTGKPFDYKPEPFGRRGGGN